MRDEAVVASLSINPFIRLTRLRSHQLLTSQTRPAKSNGLLLFVSTAVTIAVVWYDRGQIYPNYSGKPRGFFVRFPLPLSCADA